MVVREVMQVLPLCHPSFRDANMHDCYDRPHDQYDRPPIAEELGNVKCHRWPLTSPHFNAKFINAARILRLNNERVGDKEVFDYLQVVNRHGSQ